jgi:Domain of unknown function (DUF3854)
LAHFAGENHLLEAFWRLPGVYAKDRPGGGYRDCLVSQMHGALAIPVADVAGRWVAIQLRRREEDLAEPSGSHHTPRYIMLSSRTYGGMSSGSPIFLARPTEVQNRSRIAMTEGAFKALVLAEYYGCLALALPGIGIQAGVLPLLETLRERGEIEADAHALIVFDQEPEKLQVALARDRLGDALRKNGCASLCASGTLRSGKASMTQPMLARRFTGSRFAPQSSGFEIPSSPLVTCGLSLSTSRTSPI